MTFLTPNAEIHSRDRVFIEIGWAAFIMVLWQFLDIAFLPKPLEVLTALGELRNNGTLLEFWPSITTMIEAIIFTCTLSLGLAYAYTIPLLRPISSFVSGLRYLGLVGLMLVFTLVAPSGHALKVMVLTFGMTVFFLRDTTSIVRDIRQEQYDHARVLGMGPWRTLYEVVVRGTLAEALESLRVNAAMGWMMLTMVEGVVRSEGGIGVALLNMNRHLDLAALGATLILLYCVGRIQDILLGFFRDNIACRYATLGRGK